MSSGLYPDLYLYPTEPPSVKIERPLSPTVSEPPGDVPPSQIPGPNKEPIYPLGYLPGVAGAPSQIPPLRPLWWANINDTCPYSWYKAVLVENTDTMIPTHTHSLIPPTTPRRVALPPPLPPSPSPQDQTQYRHVPGIVSQKNTLPEFHCPIEGCKSDFTNNPERIPQLLSPANSLNSHLAKGDSVHRNEYARRSMEREGRGEETNEEVWLRVDILRR